MHNLALYRKWKIQLKEALPKNQIKACALVNIKYSFNTFI